MRNRGGNVSVSASRQAPGCHPEAQSQGQGDGKQKHRDELAHAREARKFELLGASTADRFEQHRQADLIAGFPQRNEAARPLGLG